MMLTMLVMGEVWTWQGPGHLSSLHTANGTLAKSRTQSHTAENTRTIGHSRTLAHPAETQEH